MNIRFYRGGLASLYALICGIIPTIAATPEPALPSQNYKIAMPALFQIVGLESRAPQTVYAEGDAALGPAQIVIDLGEANDRELPAYEELQTWTIIGEKGWSRAAKIEFQKRCDYLCGDEDESCYYVVIVSLTDEHADIGAPLGAIEGDYALTEFSPLIGAELAALPFNASDQFSGLFEKEDYRIVSASADNVKLAFRRRNETSDHIYEVEDAACTALAYESLGLENTTCKAISILSGSGVPLIASYADYNGSKTTPLVAFSYNGARYYAIRYGAKAEDIIGLVKAESQGWRSRFKGRGRALMC